MDGRVMTSAFPLTFIRIWASAAGNALLRAAELWLATGTSACISGVAKLMQASSIAAKLVIILNVFIGRAHFIF
jgi:hypothetical protein